MSADVLAGANDLLLQESTINAVSRDQIYVFNISPKSDSSVSMPPGSPRGNNHTGTQARMRNQYLNRKDTKNHPRYSKHEKGLRTPPAASILFSEDIHTRIRSQLRNKHVNEEIETEDHRYSKQRKGQKTPQASNFRILNIEDLYLTGSPFPPCPTSSIEDYDRAEGRSYDIDLRHISTVNTYSAQIGESESIFTAAMYEGPAAYETWRQDFDFYANIRHPNVLQLFGINAQGPIYALIFYSDIIPLSLFIRQCPPIALCYLQLRWIIDRGQAMDYLNEEIQIETLYMQTRSGLLCVGPMGPCVDHEDMLDIVERCPHRGVQTWSPQLRSAEYSNEAKVFRYIEEHLKDFHKFVGQYRTPALRSACLSTHNCKSYKMLGSVLDASSGHEVALFELSPDWEYRVHPWNTPRDGSGYRLRCSKDVYEDGWTRYTFKPGTVLSTSFQITYSIGWYESFGNTLRAAWLAQARYISLERQIKPSNCVLLDHIAFSLTFSLRNPVSVERPLYLFVGPLDIRSNSGSLESSRSINITPPVASYWSCDQSGESFHIEDRPILSQLSSPTLYTSVGSQWKSYQYKAIQDFQRLSNYDCNSRSFAEIHGFPKALVLWPRKDSSDEAIDGSPRARYEVGLDLTSLEVEIEKIHDSASVHDGQSTQPQGQVDSCGPSECLSLTNSQNNTHIESVLAESESLLLKDSFQPSTLNQDISIRTYDGEFDIEASLLMDMGGLLREKTDPSLEVPIIQVSDYGSLLAPEDDTDSPTSSLSRLFEEPEDIISISALC
ncbi:hypothetical protein F5890DRAFT_1505716 [Lentinula detonsa]|uniref:Protein kinase domain-containing protein n=1 Tax=Lentinula detonsa TaxID=2804962 RepID=A0AA38UUH0_9AGAR|nr:hypothetical protein F5890DRAFT_1505716 [Lentinula detonsa]